MAQTDEQARQIADRAQQFHSAIHQARTPDQISEVCQAAAAAGTARQQGQSAGQAVGQ
ncbi:hypothetical protein [Kitasatospora sp. MBT66]|uniref:hypothetical protein n=1 Tax=Kitasatospora sp. MBT66 TaxID=1444769 RepID=UPI001314AFEB|nr:hypothetical protein [Kitasatospora sp. MBT66]